MNDGGLGLRLNEDPETFIGELVTDASLWLTHQAASKGFEKNFIIVRSNR